MPMHSSTVSALLDSLGLTPDAVAASLRARGVKGRRKAPGDDPVANYLKKKGVVRPLVILEGVWWSTDLSHRREKARTSEAIRGFLEAFDAGSYPDLEQP